MIRAWVTDHLPQFLFHSFGPVELWQLMALPCIVLIAYIGARVVSALLDPAVARLTKHTQAKWDDIIVERMRGPLRLLLTGVIMRTLLPVAELSGPPSDWALEATRVVLLLSGYWALLRGVDIGFNAVKTSAWLVARPSTIPIFMLLSRFIKIFIVALAIIGALQQFGYPVAGILAGLGVGGVAVALGAQKTFENVIGSVMLSLDQPLKVGQFVKVNDFQGTVEGIGLRSTRFRTVSRTMISLPNGKVADAQIENYSEQDSIQVHVALTLHYATKAAQVRAILADMKLALQSDRFLPGQTTAFLTNMSDLGLSLEVDAWIKVGTPEDPRVIKQDALLSLLDIVEKHGATLLLEASATH